MNDVVTPNPVLDLLFERTVDVPRELLWRAWTTPALLKQWFTPAPWQTVDAELDLRPGGIFRTLMRSPEGQDYPNLGCFLEIVPNQKLVWTNALAPGFRPVNAAAAQVGGCGPFLFTATIVLAPQGAGTKYSALVMHADEAGRNKHDAMGFQDGWGKAYEQLVDVVRTL